MAKTTYAKLALKMDTTTVSATVDGGESFEIKQYLPVEEKLAFIERVINNCQDTDNNIYINPLKMNMFFELEVVFTYTNITFTEKQKENKAKIYDAMKSSGVMEQILGAIPEEELSSLRNYTWDCANQVYQYRQSALGIMDSIATDYSNLDLDATNISSKISNPENLALLKDIMQNYG